MLNIFTLFAKKPVTIITRNFILNIKKSVTIIFTTAIVEKRVELADCFLIIAKLKTISLWKIGTISSPKLATAFSKPMFLLLKKEKNYPTLQNKENGRKFAEVVMLNSI